MVGYNYYVGLDRKYNVRNMEEVEVRYGFIPFQKHR